MRDDYVRSALKVIQDPNILVNVVSVRVKQLRRGHRPLVESLEKLSLDDTALREISEGKISYELAPPESAAPGTTARPAHATQHLHEAHPSNSGSYSWRT